MYLTSPLASLLWPVSYLTTCLIIVACVLPHHLPHYCGLYLTSPLSTYLIIVACILPHHLPYYCGLYLTSPLTLLLCPVSYLTTCLIIVACILPHHLPYYCGLYLTSPLASLLWPVSYLTTYLIIVACILPHHLPYYCGLYLTSPLASLLWPVSYLTTRPIAGVPPSASTTSSSPLPRTCGPLASPSGRCSATASSPGLLSRDTKSWRPLTSPTTRWGAVGAMECPTGGGLITKLELAGRTNFLHFILHSYCYALFTYFWIL